MSEYLIIGAGPAGLATAVALKKADIPFEIVDAGNKVGGIWDIQRPDTPMYQSAHFISSKTLSGFEDYPMPNEYPDYPNHRLIQAYIESYAAKHHLISHARFQTRIEQLEPHEQKWKATLSDGSSKIYKGVICATGITWHKNLPSFPGNFTGEYIHSLEYNDPSIFAGKSVLIIGAGNSGCDIACDAARSADQAFISLRRGYYFLPKYTFGMPSDVFKQRYRIPHKYLDTKISELLLNKVLIGKLERFGLPMPDHHLMESHPIMNSRLLHHLGHGDISAKVNVHQFHGKEVHFEDGSTESVDLIIAATGYKRMFPFLPEYILGKNKEHPEIDLYLEIFSKKYHNLFFVGGIEIASAIFSLLNLQGNLIAAYISAQRNNTKFYQHFQNDKKESSINLKGKNRYIDSQRHQRYVDKNLYQRILHQQLKKFSK